MNVLDIQDESSLDAVLGNALKVLASRDAPSLAVLIEARRNELNLSVKAASEVLVMKRTSYDRLIRGELQKLDMLTALKLAYFLDVGIEEVMKLFAASSMPTEDYREAEQSKARTFVAKNFDVDSLKKTGFIESSDHAHVVERVISYFGLGSLYEYGTELSAVLFSRTKATVEDKMMKLWVFSAYKQFERINNPNPFDPEKLEKLVTQLKPYTRKEKTGLLTVMQALFNVGVTVITQQSIPKTSVRGGTFMVHKKPCIVITDHNKRYPTLWFTLLHELAHVIFHREQLATMKYHVSDGIGDAFLMESQADQFAQTLLLPQRKLDYIKNYINLDSFVQTYAAQNSIHPSIIYALHVWELNEKGDDSGWARFNRQLTKTDVCSDKLHTNQWHGATLEVEADTAKNLLTAQIQPA